MKVNGFRLQMAINAQIERRSLAEGRFAGSLKKFEDESKPDPRKLMQEYADAETKIALLQATQDKYNLAVMVEVDGTKLGSKISLHEAVKLVGGARRVEQKWRDAAKGDADRYGGDVRDRDAIVAKRQIELDQCAELAKEAARTHRALRYAIQKGNATELDLPIDLGLD